MPVYQILFCDEEGLPSVESEFECKDDEEAISYATRLLYPYELWIVENDRVVARLPPDQTNRLLH